MTTLYLVAGARPNFMKIAPIVRAIQAHGGLDFRIIHTGQHYDREMNEVFFEELGIPEPDVFMAAGRRQPCAADGEDHGGFRGALPDTAAGCGAGGR